MKRLLLVIICMAVLMPMVSSAQVVDLSAGLVGYWNFDDPDNLGMDYSGFGNHAVAFGSVGFFADGAVGGAAQFNVFSDSTIADTTTMQVAIQKELLPRRQLSYSFWIKTESQEEWRSVIRNDGHFTAMQLNGYNFGGGTWAVPFINGGFQYNTDNKGYERNFTDDSWYHFAVTWFVPTEKDSGQISVYMDGDLVWNVGMVEGILDVTEMPLVFGGTEHDNPGELFSGELDEIRMYNRVLSLDEILTLADERDFAFDQVPNVALDLDAGLVGFYDFEDAADLGKDAGNAAADGVASGVVQVEGISGQAGYFDGSSEIRVASDKADFSAEELTISAWLNTNMDVQGYTSVLRHDGHFSALQFMPEDSADMYKAWSVPFIGGSYGGGVSYRNLKTSLFDSTWHHYLATYKNYADGSGGSVTIYVDGEVVVRDDETFSGALGTASGKPFMIGRSENNNEGYTGSIDQVRVYNRALNAREIIEIYKVESGQIISGVESTRNAPRSFALEQNYPNPFNPTTSISYAIDKPAKVKVTVYNMLGEKVKTLVDNFQNASAYRVEFDARDMASGVYFCRLTVGDKNVTRKMLYLK
ncbi:T9SS type A sorting domain-containing protein [bacterium]|nr:T9SS type A sorting domain-containing protein [bacterium]